MGYNSEFAASRGPIVFDIETCALPDAAQYLEPVQAAKNLKDPAKIAADIAERTAERDEKCGLDYNVARIVCIGSDVGGETVSLMCRTEAEEANAIRAFWADAQGRRMVGFRCREFDLPMLIQRSRYLGIKAPNIDLGRYNRANRVIDLYDVLTFQDSQRTFAMRRTLHAFCRRFNIPVADETHGSDIAAMVAAEYWAGVQAHCESDVRLTRALAERLGVVEAAHAGVL
jgi:DNA polymerase elongation subunit (family B)